MATMTKDELREFLSERREARLRAYEACPADLGEHFGIEQTMLGGGYGYRQVLELVQNGADAMLEARQNSTGAGQRDRMHVALRGSALYVANTGAPLSKDGLEALLQSHSSPKRGNQIGRFGLGFKALLALGGRIDIWTRTAGGLRFDPARCRRELSKKFGAEEVPGLRLAWPIDDAERASNPILNDFDWAETIVCAEVKKESVHEHLRQEIEEFPEEFLLFLDAEVDLVLEGEQQEPRTLQVTRVGNECILSDGASRHRWRVVTRTVHVTDSEAREDATRIHQRDIVPASWAIALDGVDVKGRFWAFFPTNTTTHLSGILNAPWKMNSDRTGVIPGPWNEALMREAAAMIAQTLPMLGTEDDPGAPLDHFPRQLDGSDDVAKPLLDALWERAIDAEVIADANGRLRRPSELYRHPTDDEEIVRAWVRLASEDERAQMVHPSCLRGDRASRLERLAGHLRSFEEGRRLSKRDAQDWLEAVASTESDRAIEVFKLAEAYKRTAQTWEWGRLRPRLEIVPSSEGDLKSPVDVVICPAGARIPIGRTTVAQALVAQEEARRLLIEVLQVPEIQDDGWQEYLRSCLKTHDWHEFWQELRKAPVAVRRTFVHHNKSRMHLLCLDGKWRGPSEVLRIGELIRKEDADENQGILIDEDFHAEDASVIEILDISQIPSHDTAPGRMPEQWHNYWRHQWRKAHIRGTWDDTLRLSEFVVPQSALWLDRLSAVPRARLTENTLRVVGCEDFSGEITYSHKYKWRLTIEIPHPLPWLLLRHGRLFVGDRTVALSALVARRDDPALEVLEGWTETKAILERLAQAEPKVKPSPEELAELWEALAAFYETLSFPDSQWRALWASAARDDYAPDDFQGRPLEEVFVTDSESLAQVGRGAGYAVAILDETARKLWIERGARDLAEHVRVHPGEPDGPSCLLIELEPDLAELLAEGAASEALAQPVVGLAYEIDGQPHPTHYLFHDGVLLYDRDAASGLSRTGRLRSLLEQVSSAGWLKGTFDVAVRELCDERADELRARVAEGRTPEERLARAVGGRKEPLLEALGRHAHIAEDCDTEELARLVLAQFGPSTLSLLENALEAEGLKPPKRWGTSKAREFVTALGFPLEYAASPTTRREPEEEVDGPIPLPPLHDYQEEVMGSIQELWARDEPRRRAVISLPTGAGKTRVTVEALVELVLKSEQGPRLVLWVAQTDEICEQAMEAFRQVWLNRGSERLTLRLVRLWGETSIRSQASLPARPSWWPAFRLLEAGRAMRGWTGFRSQPRWCWTNAITPSRRAIRSCCAGSTQLRPGQQNLIHPSP